MSLSLNMYFHQHLMKRNNKCLIEKALKRHPYLSLDASASKLLGMQNEINYQIFITVITFECSSFGYG